MKYFQSFFSASPLARWQRDKNKALNESKEEKKRQRRSKRWETNLISIAVCYADAQRKKINSNIKKKEIS